MSKVVPEVILVSQFSLPYSKIGSWTTMYKNYLLEEHLIDYIICPKPEDGQFPNVNYKIIENSLVEKVKSKATKNRYLAYLKALESLIDSKGKYVIQVIDNFGFIKALDTFIENKPDLKERIYIQFFYHGFSPFYGNFQSRRFFEFIDEMVVLTKASYKAHKEYYSILPCMFSILPNGVDTNAFYKVSNAQKLILKKKYSVEDKKVFLWCSQDRPKKGLDLLLNAWKLIYQKHNNIELWVIGSSRVFNIDGVKSFGRLPNEELPKYYQAADCYLFPTLCHEGFGLSLVEALETDNYIIASALGGVPEVLKNGAFGQLINNPHFIEEWINAIDDFINKYPISVVNSYTNTYTSKNWNRSMNELIKKAKKLA